MVYHVVHEHDTQICTLHRQHFQNSWAPPVAMIWSKDGLDLLTTDTTGTICLWTVVPNEVGGSGKHVAGLHLIEELRPTDLLFQSGPFTNAGTTDDPKAVRGFPVCFGECFLFGLGWLRFGLVWVLFFCHAALFKRLKRIQRSTDKMCT